MVEPLEFGVEAVIGMNEDPLVVRVDDSMFAAAMLDGGEIAGRVCDEEIFGYGTWNFGESVEGLTSGFAMFGDIT